MDIEPTVVEVKDIVILDKGIGGGAVTIQVHGVNNATAPLQIPLGTLREFAKNVMDIDPELGRLPQAVERPAPLNTELQT